MLQLATPFHPLLLLPLLDKGVGGASFLGAKTKVTLTTLLRIPWFQLTGTSTLGRVKYGELPAGPWGHKHEMKVGLGPLQQERPGPGSCV